MGTVSGIISGVISISHIAQENYLAMSPRATALVTWAFIVGMFLPWAFAGFRTVRKTRRLALGLFAAVWSAVVCMVLTLNFGFAQLLTSLSWLESTEMLPPLTSFAGAGQISGPLPLRTSLTRGFGIFSLARPLLRFWEALPPFWQTLSPGNRRAQSNEGPMTGARLALPAVLLLAGLLPAAACPPLLERSP